MATTKLAAEQVRSRSDDIRAAESVLAAALAEATITGRADAAAFERLHHLLRLSFPRLHSALRREAIGPGHALLYTWPGQQLDLRPWAILAHQDVVGVETGTEASWTHCPFGGDVADGYVWGRGALDMKSSFVGAMQAIEDLLSAGFAPHRTLLLCFGADEETGGREGAARIAALLRRRGQRLSMTLDEGGFVLTNGFPGVRRPVALIGTAQKGVLALRLTVRETAGGHAALPGFNDATSRLLKCLVRLQGLRFSTGLNPPAGEMLLALARTSIPLYRALYLLSIAVAKLGLGFVLRRTPIGRIIGTTLAVTQLAAGLAENVTPQLATATLDIRVSPSDSTAQVAQRVAKEATQFGVSIETLDYVEPSPASSPDTAFFQAIIASLESVAPGAVPVPYLSPTDGDSKHFADIADRQYRFVPITLAKADLARLHGTDERIAIEGYRGLVGFYQDLIRSIDGINAAAGSLLPKIGPCA